MVEKTKNKIGRPRKNSQEKAKSKLEYLSFIKIRRSVKRLITCAEYLTSQGIDIYSLLECKYIKEIFS